MPLFKVRRTAKPNVIPAGLTYGELAVNVADALMYVGGTAGEAVLISGGGGVRGPTGPTGPTGPQMVMIDSFGTSIDPVVPKGNSNYSLDSKTVSLSYLGGTPPLTGGIYLTDPSKGTGFPVYFPTAGMDHIAFSGQTLTADVGASVTLRVVVTGSAGGSDYYDYEIAFSNYIRWGATAAASLTGTQVHTVLTNYSVSESLSQEFKLQVSAGDYLYLSHPSRLGRSVQSINSVGYGGMDLQGQQMIVGSPEVVAVNDLGFADTYYIYRSENKMGTGTLFVRTAAL